jgi:LPXTG-site transpeptidase (sortase) family protein
MKALCVFLAVILLPIATSIPASASSNTTDWYLEIPSLRFGADIYVGDQESIDAGSVTLFDGWSPAVAPGEVGTVWLAGHRSSHGAPFRKLPRLRAGQTVNINSYDQVFTYRIATRTVTSQDPPAELIYGLDPAARRIVLQCSWTRGRSIVYVGFLESVQPVL